MITKYAVVKHLAYERNVRFYSRVQSWQYMYNECHLVGLLFKDLSVILYSICVLHVYGSLAFYSIHISGTH